MTISKVSKHAKKKLSVFKRMLFFFGGAMTAICTLLAIIGYPLTLFKRDIITIGICGGLLLMILTVYDPSQRLFTHTKEHEENKTKE